MPLLRLPLSPKTKPFFYFNSTFTLIFMTVAGCGGWKRNTCLHARKYVVVSDIELNELKRTKRNDMKKIRESRKRQKK